MMELRMLKIFLSACLVLAEEKTISRAAEILHITHISNLLKKPVIKEILVYVALTQIGIFLVQPILSLYIGN